eukprot:TRINITY_DN9193_c0_g1_i1.p1 TRINITY_DN9193_c0_g1~~TRINITY_DN9193_c0_g1_i1.p1  ORF type:complete len:114 (-),score=28.68 TRINITY_DN9193_c0_g1_i1:339-644(-)
MFEQHHWKPESEYYLDGKSFIPKRTKEPVDVDSEYSIRAFDRIKAYDRKSEEILEEERQVPLAKEELAPWGLLVDDYAEQKVLKARHELNQKRIQAEVDKD